MNISPAVDPEWVLDLPPSAVSRSSAGRNRNDRQAAAAGFLQSGGGGT